jgi:hypothetical protein
MIRKHFRKVLASVAFLAALALSQHAFAQAATQQSPTHLDACTGLAHAHAASTVTITPPAGQYVYICEVDLSNVEGATVVTAAAPLFVTTTNLPGPPQYMAASGGATPGAGGASPVLAVSYMPGALKSSAGGTAVTFILPAFTTNQTLSLNVSYYFAP